MCKLNKKSGDTRIDPCIRHLIAELRKKGFRTVGSCCGHFKYPLTIVIERRGRRYDLVSGVFIPRRKKSYKKDKQGYYYIPEVQDE